MVNDCFLLNLAASHKYGFWIILEERFNFYPTKVHVPKFESASPPLHNGYLLSLVTSPKKRGASIHDAVRS